MMATAVAAAHRAHDAGLGRHGDERDHRAADGVVSLHPADPVLSADAAGRRHGVAAAGAAVARSAPRTGRAHRGAPPAPAGPARHVRPRDPSRWRPSRRSVRSTRADAPGRRPGGPGARQSPRSSSPTARTVGLDVATMRCGTDGGTPGVSTRRSVTPPGQSAQPRPVQQADDAATDGRLVRPRPAGCDAVGASPAMRRAAHRRCRDPQRPRARRRSRQSARRAWSVELDRQRRLTAAAVEPSHDLAWSSPVRAPADRRRAPIDGHRVRAGGADLLGPAPSVSAATASSGAVTALDDGPCVRRR